MTSIVRKDWTTEEISKWWAEVNKEGAQVYYSSNGGLTWMKFQRSTSGIAENDLARILTLVHRDNIVRDVKQEKIKVTSEQAQVLNPTSSFFNSIAAAQAQADAANATVRPAPGSRHSEDIVNIFRTEGGAYSFNPLPLDEFSKTHPAAKLVSKVTRTTYYDAITANKNEVTIIGLHPGQVNPAPRQAGFVFRLTDADKDRNITHWWPILTAANPNIKPNEWLSVKCARHYDDNLDETFNNLGTILSVVGGKWIWSWTKRYKLGDTWIVPLSEKDALIKRLTARGMAIEPEPAASEPQHNPVALVNHSADLSPEYIMGIRENLDELLRLGDKAAIIDTLFKVIEFRNKCVDELKELNKSIDKARDVVASG